MNFTPRLAVFGLAIVLFVFMSGCSITKNLNENEYLVASNTITGHLKSKIDRQEIEPFIRQKPNRKILSILPFNLWLYNQIDKEKLIKQKEKRDARFERKNEKRIAKNKIRNEKRARKGKEPKEPRLKNKDKPTLRESLLEVSEEPVIYDSTTANLSASQISRYLFSKGYFYSKVRDSVSINKRSKRAHVFYHIIPGKQYFINSVKYSIPDEELASFVLKDTIHSKLKKDRPFDAEVLQKERERITAHLLDNGYYFFETDYIYYEVDSALKNQKIDLTVNFKKFPVYATQDKDSVSYVKHPRYTINSIYIITEELKTSYRDEYFKDTIEFKNYFFLIKNKLKYKRSAIAQNIEFSPGEIFCKSLAEKTYKRILNLGVFRNVLIQFSKNPYHNDRLDCYIICNPLIKQSITVETEGTNTSGNLGVDGSLLFQNKNLLKGAELFELSLNGALIAQKQFNTTQTSANNIPSTFNTIQFGPSMRFSVPRAAFPFSLFPFKKDAFPKTYISTSVNYQSRPEFNRFITSINYGFTFRSEKSKLRHDIIPFEVYSVKANLTDNFKSSLLSTNDYFLLNSFQDHITTLSKYSITYNNQVFNGPNTTRKPVSYIKINLASSGNILRGLFEMSKEKTDTLGRYLIGGIPFAQFVKVDFDYRLYIPIREKNRVVYRTMIGVGKPLSNLNVLPYEQSYFSGGPNSNRAWRARTLGPGGYAPASDNKAKYDRIGDIIIEGNIEYRFHIFRSFYGAWFVDAGNVWQLRKDPSKPNGDFKMDRFYKEIAVGTGWGIRWDLNFFILRLDAGVPIVDPKYAEGDRWTFNKKPLQRTTLNFGIGYPF